jgi:phosphatidylglycerophosphate synthase
MIYDFSEAVAECDSTILMSGAPMELGPQQFGKWLVLIGALIIVVGVLVMLLGKVGLFRLPGDFEFGGRNWRVYLPLASSIILSLLLTLIFWLIHYFSSRR